LAGQLISFHRQGKYSDDNGRQMAQLQKIVLGQKWTSQCGTVVEPDPRIFEVLIWLINLGYSIGTYAWCEDHHCNAGLHPKGRAVDISSINGHSIGSDSASGPLVIAVDKLLNYNVPPGLKLTQLISGGFAGHSDFQCRSLTIPNTGYYGEATMAQHLNHIHVGF